MQIYCNHAKNFRAKDCALFSWGNVCIKSCKSIDLMIKVKLRNWGKGWEKKLVIRWIINPPVPLARVVLKSESVIHRINRYPEDKNYGKQLCHFPFEQCLGMS